LRDEYAEAFIANPNDYKNPFAEFAVVFTASSERIVNSKSQPVLRRRPKLDDEGLDKLIKQMNEQ
jgi:hypothetical protein